MVGAGRVPVELAVPTQLVDEFGAGPERAGAGEVLVDGVEVGGVVFGTVPGVEGAGTGGGGGGQGEEAGEGGGRVSAERAEGAGGWEHGGSDSRLLGLVLIYESYVMSAVNDGLYNQVTVV